MTISRAVLVVLVIALAVAADARRAPKKKAVEEDPAAAPKVMVGVYIESYCPDCMDMITEYLYPAYAKQGLDSIMNVVFYPYGNAKEELNGTQWAFECQHKAKECQGNFLEVCAIQYYPDTAVHFPFINCLEASTDPIHNGESCAKQFNMDYSLIAACANGEEANALEHANAVNTDALVPEHDWVPWVTVNGVHVGEDADGNPIAAICDAYTGKVKPAACTPQASSHKIGKSRKIRPVAAAPKVMVALYFESLCPGCEGLITNTLYPNYTKAGLDSIMNLVLYPYGNAKEVQDGTTWAYTCQHGDDECQGNFIEVCAIKYYPNTADHFAFIQCIEASGAPADNAEACAKQLNLNYTLIDACANGEEANALEHAAAVNTDALVPKHDHVPWVTINGKHISEDADVDPIAAICDAYTGSPKPAACKKTDE